MFEFSIAIPAHDRGENGPKWMIELLDSLERQTFQDFEVVVSCIVCDSEEEQAA